MSYTRQIIFLFCCISNVSLSIDPTSQNNDKKEVSGTIKYKQSDQQFIADKCIEDQLTFLDLLISGEMTQLLTHIQHPNLPMAEIAFHILKNCWPWKRDYTFLIPSLTNDTEESDYITKLGVDIMKIIERDHITRKDYIEKHAAAQSLKTIQEYKEKCILLQKKGDLESLSNEVDYLYHRVVKNGEKNNLIDNICLAIAEKIYLDPVSTFLHTIVHAPSLEEAQNAVKSLEAYLLNQTKEANII